MKIHPYILLLTLMLTPFYLYGQDDDNPPYIQYIADDSLTLELLAELENIETHPSFIKSVHTRENTHVKNQIDTIYTLTTPLSTLKVYKTPTKKWLISAILKDKTFVLLEHIKIGMSIKDFLKYINHDVISDDIRIGVLESNMYFKFLFHEEQLTEIQFCLNID